MALPSLTDALRSRGLRITVQRQLVMEAVERLGHATPEQVHGQVTRTAAGINLTTVYRTLELLEQIGLIRHTHLIDAATTYHLAADQHFHLVCRACRTVYEAPTTLLSRLAAQLADERGFSTDVGHVALFGVCAECTESAQLGEANLPGAATHDSEAVTADDAGNTTATRDAAHSGPAVPTPEVLS